MFEAPVLTTLRLRLRMLEGRDFEEYAAIDPLNENSRRVAERLGEAIEGETEIDGHRLLVYGITRTATRPGP